MKLARSSTAVLAVSLVVPAVALPCFADEPPPPGSVPELDEDRGSVGGALPSPSAAPPPSSSAPAAPGGGGSAPGARPLPSAPPGYGPAPGYGPGAPPGYSPPGYYPPPAYSPPRTYYAPPAYYPPPPAYGPVPAGGDSPDDFRVGPGRPYPGDEVSSILEARRQRRAATGMIIAGATSLGLGWIGAALHGLMGDLLGYGEYRAIFLPLVGPIVEASTHNGDFTSGEKIGLVFEGVFQLGGLASLIAGVVIKPGKGSTASMPVTIALSPSVSPHAGTLGLTGTF